ncbi:hypothetical protein ABPG73_004647 [Tetrahymena malaccensis]
MEQELCQTTLEAFMNLCKQKNSYPSTQMKEIMTIQILDSVAFLHRFDVVHRDIKPSNFLLNFDQNGNPTLKLCDLAFASALKNNETRLSISAFKGAQAYTAPEVYNKVYKKLSDLFSVGIVLLEIDNIATFDISKTTLEEKFETKNGMIFQNFKLDRSSQIYKIATQCLKYEVNQRLPAVDLLIQFIVQNQQYLNVDVFTLLNKSQLNKNAQQLNQIQMSISQKKKKNEQEMFELSQVFNKDLHLEKLMSKYQQLYNNKIGSDGAKAVASEISKSTNLSTLTLSLYDNNIGSDGAKAVASEIAKSTNLSTLTLDLGYNKIGSDGAKAVASEIAKSTNLSTLSLQLQYNKIGSDGAKAVASEIAKSTNLSTLTLSLYGNHIDSDGAKAVASEIAKSTILSTLTLSLNGNNIGSDGAKAVASEIAKSTNLSTLTLDLGGNNIGSDGAKAVASEIAKSTNLSTLTLSLYGNHIGSDGAKAVASKIAKSTNLSTLTLDLTYIGIDSNGVKAFAYEISKCKNLLSLDLVLRHNNLDGKSSLESIFGNQISLKLRI